MFGTFFYFFINSLTGSTTSKFIPGVIRLQLLEIGFKTGIISCPQYATGALPSTFNSRQIEELQLLYEIQGRYCYK